MAILGMGGVGKTALSVKLVQEIQSEFEYLIWRSLRNAPSIQDLLAQLIQFLSQGQETHLPETVDSKVLRLIEYLRSSRCLLVLDNAETILREGDRAGSYREGYEGYGQLLRCVAETPHHSRLVLTSREKPKGLAAKEGELAVRSLQLSGLPTAAGREIFKAKGDFWASESEWRVLVEHYAGNPLALKIIAPKIQDFFGSSVSKFLELLKQDTFVFDEIRSLLERQFTRLSNLEKEVMYWLAINREPVSFSELQADIVRLVRNSEIIEALVSLQRRSLIEKTSSTLVEKTSNGFTQQPVVMEYVTEQLIKQVCAEINTTEVALLMSHALLKAEAKDYVRTSQVRVILEPIAAIIRVTFRTQKNVEEQFKQILLKLREKFPASSGYATGNIINLCRHLEIDLTGYDFSNLAVWQAYLQDLNLHQVNFAYADLAKSIFAETFGSILSVTFSPDGKLLAASDTNGEIRLWRVLNGQQLLTCKGHTSWILAVTFSPDGQTLASSGLDQTIRLWDVTTGQCLKTLYGHTNFVMELCFSPDGQTLASSSADLSIILWDVTTGECLKTLTGHANPVQSVSFSPNGQTLVSGSADQSIRQWDVATGQCFKILQGHTSWIWSVCFSPDGQTLASASSDRTVRLWDANTGVCLKVLQGHTQLVYSVAFNPDGRTLASGSSDRTVRLWDANTGQCLKVLQGHAKKVWSVTFSPDGKTLVSGSEDQAIKLWDASTGRCFKTLQGHTAWVWSATFSPDGLTLVSGNQDGTIRLWDVVTGQCLKSLKGHKSWVWSVTFSPDGRTLVSGSEDQTVKLWDVKTGQCLNVLQEHTSSIASVAFSPEGQTLAVTSNDTTVWLGDVRTGKCLRILQGHTQLLRPVSFSPDGQTLASGSHDQTVRLWDVNTGKALKVLLGHTGLVTSIIFS